MVFQPGGLCAAHWLGQLNQDATAIAAVFGVMCIQGIHRGARSGKEVDHDVASVGALLQVAGSDASSASASAYQIRQSEFGKLDRAISSFFRLLRVPNFLHMQAKASEAPSHPEHIGQKAFQARHVAAIGTPPNPCPDPALENSASDTAQ
jgi:hypothetical protein